MLLPTQQSKLARGAKDKRHVVPENSLQLESGTIGIDPIP